MYKGKKLLSEKSLNLFCAVVISIVAKVSNHTAQEGARIHRRLQKEAGDAYQKRKSFFKNRKRDRKGQVNYRRTCRRLIL